MTFALWKIVHHVKGMHLLSYTGSTWCIVMYLRILHLAMTFIRSPEVTYSHNPDLVVRGIRTIAYRAPRDHTQIDESKLCGGEGRYYCDWTVAARYQGQG